MNEHFTRSNGHRGAKPPRVHGRVTLDQLRTFVAVAEREHVTAAAEALDQSQGSVSTQVRRLERALSLPLLHRVGRNVRLTDVGEAVHRLALDVLERAQAIEDMAAGYRVVDRGEISVTAGSVIGSHRLSTWLSPFAQTHPHVDIHITMAAAQAAMDGLGSGRFDILVIGDAVPASGMETLSLEQTELVIVVAAQHPLARTADPLAKLALHRHLVHEKGSVTQVLADQVIGQHADGAPTVQLEEAALLAGLHAGLGFSIMPRSIVEPEIAAGRLVVLPQPGKAVPVVFTAMRRPGPSTPAVEALWSHLRGVAVGAPPDEPVTVRMRRTK